MVGSHEFADSMIDRACDFSFPVQDISPHETFSHHADSKHNPNPNNLNHPAVAVTITCHKVKRLEMNFPDPNQWKCDFSTQNIV